MRACGSQVRKTEEGENRKRIGQEGSGRPIEKSCRTSEPSLAFVTMQKLHTPYSGRGGGLRRHTLKGFDEYNPTTVHLTWALSDHRALDDHRLLKGDT